MKRNLYNLINGLNMLNSAIECSNGNMENVIKSYESIFGYNSNLFRYTTTDIDVLENYIFNNYNNFKPTRIIEFGLLFRSKIILDLGLKISTNIVDDHSITCIIKKYLINLPNNSYGFTDLIDNISMQILFNDVPLDDKTYKHKLVFDILRIKSYFDVGIYNSIRGIAINKIRIRSGDIVDDIISFLFSTSILYGKCEYSRGAIFKTVNNFLSKEYNIFDDLKSLIEELILTQCYYEENGMLGYIVNILFQIVESIITALANQICGDTNISYYDLYTKSIIVYEKLITGRAIDPDTLTYTLPKNSSLNEFTLALNVFILFVSIENGDITIDEYIEILNGMKFKNEFLEDIVSIDYSYHTTYGIETSNLLVEDTFQSEDLNWIRGNITESLYEWLFNEDLADDIEMYRVLDKYYNTCYIKYINIVFDTYFKGGINLCQLEDIIITLMRVKMIDHETT